MNPSDAMMVAPMPAWMTAWPALPALLMLMVGAWGVRKRIRADPALLAILVVALVVRVAVLPIGRHEFDGHEAEYLDLFLGRRALTQGGTLLYPAMQWLSRGLGLVLRHPALLLAFHVGASLVGIGAVAGTLTRLVDRRVGLGAALVLAIWGNHAFWASSAYNVALPHALGAVALWGLACLFKGGSPGWTGLLIGGASALAVATRLEMLLLAPLGLWLLLIYRPARPLRWAPPLVLGGALGGLAAWYVLHAGQLPGEEQRGLAWSINRGLLVYFAPFDRPWTWPALLVGLALGGRRAPGLTLGLAGLVVGSHLVFATFDDYGFRHLLNAELGLAGLLGALLLRRWGWPLYGVAVVALCLHTVDVSQRYYASEEEFAASLPPDLPVLTPEEVQHCTLICEDFRVVGDAQQRSHFNLLDPKEAAFLQDQGECLWWLVGVQDHRWSSRAVRDRTLRLYRLYEHRPVALVKDLERGYVGLVLEVNGRRTPGVLDPAPTSQAY